MSLFKCKMCGGSLDVEAGATVIECEYCGTKQTLPKLDDDKRANMYDRANHFRRNNEFDKAMGIYEQILNEDNTDAEAYWSLVLCRYGIEYVEDPTYHKRIPTVNRAQFTSIFDDDNYKFALQYADSYQRTIYEEEAKAINEIQKGILAISQKEEPFDVFICYKESDNNGRRTPDSVLAQDLYYQLKQEGFKVFFARITLEDKLGSAYEPYIFAALNSAKVMVVLGTKPEHFNAVWVKNEWNRYLALIKQGQKKMLIPAYKDMDPYDLPEEFSHLQAQDMSKLGFMQDLIRGIKKIAKSDEPKTTVVKETVITDGGSTNIAPLIKRVFMFLEDSKWAEANEYCEKVLDVDPENVQAYLGKLMADIHVRKKEQLSDCRRPFDSNDNYRKVIRFADDKLKEEMIGFIEHINTRNEAERLEAEYNSIVREMNLATTEEDFKSVSECFAEMGNYKDASRLSKECLDKAEIARLDALEKAEIARKNGIYTTACKLKAKNTIKDLELAILSFKEIPECKDSQALINECEKRIEEIKVEQEKQRLEKERQDELARIAREQRIQKAKKFFKIATPTVAGVIVCILLMVLWIIPTIKLNNAVSLMEEGKYNDARTILVELDGFGSSENKLAVLDAIGTIENGEFDTAIKDVLSAEEIINVTYNLDDDKSASGDSFKYSSSAEYSALLVPQKEGYQFVEWKLSGYNYSKDNSLELILDAVWDDGYLITYNLNGGTLKTANPSEYHKEGEAVTLRNPTKTGYTFTGWTGTGLDGRTVDVTIPTGSYGNREYTANWEANEYTFTLNANGGSVNKTSVSANYGSSYTLPTPTRDYYTFEGWFDGAGKYESGAWNKADNVTLTAKWTPISYTITYNLSGGTNSSQNLKNFTAESSKISLQDPTRTGYEFIGWYSDSSYNNEITEIPAGSHENITLYAKWEIINYTITYDLNGGTMSGTPKTTFTVNDLPLTLPSATQSGLSFASWVKGTIDGEGIAEITEPGNITVVASYMDPYLNLSYSSDHSYYLVTNYNGSAMYLDIPAYYNGKPINTIGDNAFEYCSGLVTINIPNSVTKIGNSAFGYCSGLRNIVVSNSLKTIGTKAFYECDSLQSITIPDSVTSIGESVFENCTRLTSINIPNSLTSIGDSAFSRCTGLTSINIPNSVTSIGKSAFSRCTGLTSINIPSSLTSIYTSTFDGCTELTSVTIGNGVTSIGISAFSGCSGLTSITIPDSVTSIGDSAFYECTGLKSVTIGNGVTSIGEGAFNGCKGLVSVTIGNSVKSIGYDAFYGCYNLVEVYNLSRLNITAGSSSNGYVVDYAKNVYTPNNGQSKLINKDNYLFYNIDGSYYLMAYIGKDTNLILPSDINGNDFSIYQYAFYGCDNITSITIPICVTSIGEDAFYGCTGLTSVTIPDSVTSIGYNAFRNCTELASVTIGNSVTDIGSYAFSGCYKLIEVYNLSRLNITAGSTSYGYLGYHAKNIYNINNSQNNLITKNDYIFYNDNGSYYLMGYIGKDTELVLPSDINGNAYSIYNYAFSGCTQLTSITIPDSVTSISSYAFKDCTGLTDINFNGTKDQWKAIQKSYNWNSNTGSYTIHCVDGDIEK